MLTDFLLAVTLCLFLKALGRKDDSRSKCMAAVKLLNQLDRSGGGNSPEGSKNSGISSAQYKVLSQYVLSLYDSLAGPVSIETLILWLNSRLGDFYFFPEINFGDEIASSNEIFSDPQDVALQVPSNLAIQYKNIQAEDWSTDLKDMENLHQDLLSNCSFVSSVLSLVHCGLVDILYDCITPHKPSNSYSVRFNFNGCVRVVSIDNRLPVLDDDNRFITIRSSSNMQLYWPALIEKAYLKIMGKGYNIEGSNMAFDTYVLTQWVPEIVKITDGRVPDNFKQIQKVYQEGGITIGLGTGKISKTLSEQIGLVSNHDYTLLSVNMERGKLVVKNPWLEKDHKNRIMEVDMNGLFQFSYFYFNWDTKSIFKYNKRINFINQGEANLLNIWDSPQFGVTNDTDTEQDVWFFVERYFVNDPTVIIAIDVYHTSEGDKVLFPNQYNEVFTGEPTNARTKLVRFTLKPHSSYTVFVHSSIKCSMTLQMFYNAPTFTIKKAINKYPHQTSIDDEWDFSNCGGNSSLTTYLINPQFDLQVMEPTDLLISLTSPQLISFQVFYWNANDVNKCMRTFKRGDLLFDNEYANKCQISVLNNVEPGYYRIICSTKEANSRDKFNLKVFHNSPIELSKVSTSLGLFLDSILVNWNNNNQHKLKFATRSHNSRLCFHIQHSNNDFTTSERIGSYRPRMRGSLFNLDTQMPVQINEEWQTSLYGIFVECRVADPGRYVLLVERFEPGIGTLKVEVGSNNAFEIIG